MNEQGKIVFLEKKKTKWHWAGEIVLFTACVVSSTAGALAILSDRDTQSDIIELKREIDTFKAQVREENQFTQTTETVLNTNVANLTGKLAATKEGTTCSTVLTVFISDIRKEVRDEIKKRRQSL